MNEYMDMWKNYANFTGRTSVRGYWMAFLVNFAVGAVISILVAIIPALAIVSTLYSLAALVPGLAIAVRRLIDAGYRWVHVLLGFIPLVGFIILIVLLCKPSVVKEEPVVVNDAQPTYFDN